MKILYFISLNIVVPLKTNLFLKEQHTFRVHAQGRQNYWHETNGWSVVLNLLQIPTQNIAYPIYSIAEYHFDNSKQLKDACMVSFTLISEMGKTIRVTEITISHKFVTITSLKVTVQYHY